MLAAVSAGIVLGLSAGFAPGPLLALVLSQTLAHGVRQGIKVAFAPLITDLPIIAVSLLMLGQLADSRPVLGAIGLAGGVFVAWLAWGSLRAGLPRADGASVGAGALRKGALTNALSPHPYVFWLSVGAPTILRAWERSPLAAVGFVAGFLGCLVGAKVVLAVVTGRSRRLLSPRAYGWIMKGLAAALLVFAVMLVTDGIRLLGTNVQF